MSRVPRDISNLPFESRKRTKTVTSDGGQSKDLSIDCSQSSVGISQDSAWRTSPTTSLNSKPKSKATLHSNGDSFDNSNDSDSRNFDSDVDTDSNEYTSRSGRRRRRRKHKRSKRNGNLIYTSTSKRSSYHSSNESSSSEYSSSSESSYYSLVRQKPSSDSDTDSSYYSLVHRKPSRSKAKHSVKSDFNVASLPQLENKNAKSSKKEEIDLKLFDFSDEKPSPPRKLSVSSSSSEGANQQKTDALVEATSASAITLPKEKKKTFEIPVPGKEGAIPNALNGKIFVLTGVFPELRGGAGLTRGKNECITMIESFGGVVRSCISGKTNYLVVGKEPGPSKYNQAKVKGLPMLDLRELCRLMFGETTLEASSSGSGSLSSVVGKSVVIDRGATGSGDGESVSVSSGDSNASGNGGSIALLSGSIADKNGGAVSLASGSVSVLGGAVTISSGSTKLIPCTNKADPQGHAQVKNIVTSMVRGGEYPSFASVVEKYPSIGQKYKKSSLENAIGRFVERLKKKKKQMTKLICKKENESDSDDDDSLEQLIERCRSNGVNLDLTRSNAVPLEHKVLALKFVMKYGVHRPCLGALKDALLKEMLLIAEKVGFKMKGFDLDEYISRRLSWARSLCGKPNTYCGPLCVAKREEQRKEDQEALNAYLKECDLELFDERKSEKEMMSIVEEFINRRIEEFGMTFDEAVKTLTLTLYGGITGQINTDAEKRADNEAFRWTYFNSSNSNPTLVNADGTGIGKTAAERDYGFKVMWVYESICFDNAALFEKLFHLKYQNLPLGRVRCWRVAGAGQRSSIVRGQYKVFITYSTEVQAAIDARKIKIRD